MRSVRPGRRWSGGRGLDAAQQLGLVGLGDAFPVRVGQLAHRCQHGWVGLAQRRGTGLDGLFEQRHAMVAAAVTTANKTQPLICRMACSRK